MIHSDLKRIDLHAISNNKKEIRLFSVMKNEALRLPYFFEYYRHLGVSQFFIIDNGSTDETQKFLLEQLDCCVFFTARDYSRARFGVDWLNSLMDAYGDDHWILTADADELLVYPGSELNLLPKLCGWLDKEGHQGVSAIMLDMYSSLPLNKVEYKKGDNFLNVCDQYDSDYYFVRRYSSIFVVPAFPSHEPIGGPRLRLCFPSQNTKELWPRLSVKIKRRLLRLVQKFGLAQKIEIESVAPQAFKIPLVKWCKGYAYITSHRLNPIKLSSVSGAVLHFKYFQDFSARVLDAVNNLNHYDGSAEYKMYAQLMLRDEELSLAYNGSAKYTNTDDLVHQGLIKTDQNWANQ